MSFQFSFPLFTCTMTLYNLPPYHQCFLYRLYILTLSPPPLSFSFYSVKLCLEKMGDNILYDSFSIDQQPLLIRRQNHGFTVSF